MKKIATVTETMVYFVEFEAEESATEDEIHQAARDEWDANPGRKPHDYTCEIDVSEELLGEDICRRE